MTGPLRTGGNWSGTQGELEAGEQQQGSHVDLRPSRDPGVHDEPVCDGTGEVHLYLAEFF